MIKNTGIVEQVRLWDGCQSYWKLDETSGTFVADSIGGNNGVATSITWNANGKNGYCAEYNAATDRIECGNTFNYERTQAWSISCWVKRVTVGTSAYFIFSKSLASGAYTGYGAYFLSSSDGGNPNGILFSLVNNSNINSIQLRTATNYTDTTNWYHLVFTYNGTSKASGCTVYTNGVKETLTAPYDNLTGTIINTAGFQIGARNNALSLLGLMDEFAVWNRVLREDEVKMLYSAGNGKFYGTKALSFKDLIHYYNFNETGGTTVYDRKGAYNGTLTSTAARTTSGKSYSGMTFTSGHYCSYGTPFTWTAAQPYSVSCWVKAPSNPTPVIPILSNLDSSTSGTIDIYFNTNNAYFGLFYNNTTGRCFCTAAGALADTNWHHFLFTYNGSSSAYGMQIYKDGVAVGTANTNTLTNTGNLGATLYTNRRYTTNYDNGAIVDEIAIFNKALTVNDAIALYNAGNGLYY